MTPIDSTNANIATAGTSLSGDAVKRAAIRRIQIQQQKETTPQIGRLRAPPGPPKIGKF